jgi:hypothetical protein
MDLAAEYIAQAGQRYPPLSPAEEKKLIRRMDWILVPMVCACQTFFVFASLRQVSKIHPKAEEEQLDDMHGACICVFN